MKKISRIEYCAGFEPLQSGMEQDEGSRILLPTMEYFKTSATIFSFVVDSPRAKEASISSSKDILKMISQMEMLPQIILATIDYSEYDSEIETPANIIVLTEKRKLLNESDYVKNQDTIMAISELLKKQV